MESIEVAKILIVEDDLIIGMHTSTILTNLGYEVVGIAHSGEKAF